MVRKSGLKVKIRYGRDRMDRDDSGSLRLNELNIHKVKEEKIHILKLT